MGEGDNNRVNTLNEWPNGPMAPPQQMVGFSRYLYISSTQTAESTQSTFPLTADRSSSKMQQRLDDVICYVKITSLQKPQVQENRVGDSLVRERTRGTRVRESVYELLFRDGFTELR